MSFLVRRNVPRAWAGYQDNFTTYPEGDVIGQTYWPWVHLGGGRSYINNLDELVVTEQVVNDDGRGPSYAWQPFTPNWGFECEVWYPVEGIDNQHFFVVFTDSWSKVAPTKFQKAAAVGFKHELGGADNMAYAEFPDMFTPFGNLHTWAPPGGAFFGRTLNLRVWCENDEWLRIWLNGTYVGSAMPSAQYKLGPTRRAVRLVNRSYCNAWVRKIDHYDRPSTIPPMSVWSSIFYDDFNRADGAVANGWTQLGTDAAIVSGHYKNTATTTDVNRSVGLIRDVGNLDGRARIEAVVRNATSTADGSLMLFCNAAGTQALVANIYSNHIYLGRMTSAVNGTPSFFDFQDRAAVVNNGDKIAFTVYDEICWLEINGTKVVYAGNVHNVVPRTNPYAGLRVSRDGTATSVQFDDVRIYSGVGL
ncbi:hypothetical protein [Nocardia ignorata]|uniref:Uncharacterized protein n=1 Tax=Nocardia ignorata TaxID=145285 RepID=A0A4R6NZL9_NOCIG|nr:hypothetical protein [Nocardia ignorata]TDP29747.1 hypothetical protein DFR75_1128 [Nocardia ignorata]